MTAAFLRPFRWLWAWIRSFWLAELPLAPEQELLPEPAPEAEPPKAEHPTQVLIRLGTAEFFRKQKRSEGTSWQIR